MSAVLRVYAGSEDKVQNLIAEAEATVVHLRSVGIELNVFSVWRDPYQPNSDYGGTAALLKAHFAGQSDVQIQETNGDLFVDALNQGYEKAFADGMTHALALSTSARHMITDSVVRAAIAAFTDADHPAKIVGVVHPDFPELSQWSITNTHCFYDLQTLKQYGWLDGWDRRPARFDAGVHNAGVLEAYNALKFAHIFERPVTTILDTGVTTGDTRTDDVHMKKLKNKERRLMAMLGDLGMSVEDFATATLISTAS